MLQETIQPCFRDPCNAKELHFITFMYFMHACKFTSEGQLKLVLNYFNFWMHGFETRFRGKVTSIEDFGNFFHSSFRLRLKNLNDLGKNWGLCCMFESLVCFRQGKNWGLCCLYESLVYFRQGNILKIMCLKIDKTIGEIHNIFYEYILYLIRSPEHVLNTSGSGREGNVYEPCLEGIKDHFHIWNISFIFCQSLYT